MTTVAAARDDSAESRGAPTFVVDADVHEYFKGFSALVPYLSGEWARLITDWGFKGIDVGFPYTSSSVVRTWEARLEWRPEDDGDSDRISPSCVETFSMSWGSRSRFRTTFRCRFPT